MKSFPIVSLLGLLLSPVLLNFEPLSCLQFIEKTNPNLCMLQLTVWLQLNLLADSFQLPSLSELKRILPRNMVEEKLRRQLLTAWTRSLGSFFVYFWGLSYEMACVFYLCHAIYINAVISFVNDVGPNWRSRCNIVLIIWRRLASCLKWRLRFQKWKVLWWKTLRR